MTSLVVPALLLGLEDPLKARAAGLEDRDEVRGAVMDDRLRECEPHAIRYRYRPSTLADW